MHPKTPFFSALLLALSLTVAHAIEFKWDGKGTIRIDNTDGWKLEGAPAEGLGFTITGHPDSGVPLVFQVTLLDVPADRPVQEEELVGHLEASLQRFLEQSVEKEVHPIALKMKQGRGWFAELTDSSLVGKPSVPNDYKILRNAIALLDPHALVVATMQCDDVDGVESAEMLRMLSSLRFDRWSAGAPAVQVAPALDASAVAQR